MTTKYYPKLSELTDLDSVPSFFGNWITNSTSVLDELYFRNYNFNQSHSGDEV